jgi:hypothetical protein
VSWWYSFKQKLPSERRDREREIEREREREREREKIDATQI